MITMTAMKKNKNIVYIVHSGDSDPYYVNIFGIFTDKKVANKTKKEADNFGLGDYDGGIIVRPIKLDEPYDFSKNKKQNGNNDSNDDEE